MENLNLVELLRDCPNGMDLDCAIWDNCTFEGIEDVGYINILVKTPNGLVKLSKEGYLYHNHSGSKCVIFPKGKTTWEGFVSPCKFKNGDVISAIVNKKLWYGIYQKEFNAILYCYVSYSDATEKIYPSSQNGMCFIGDILEIRFATEEEKQKLFDAIKANGYKWNAETKTLEKLIEPIFEVGNKIEKCGYRFTIAEVKDDYYLTKCGNKIPIDNQDDFSLVPTKFDITTLKPFDKVLVRDCNKDKWNIDFFGYYRDDGTYQCMTFTKNQCIPYEVNKELLGTTNNPKGYGSE